MTRLNFEPVELYNVGTMSLSLTDTPVSSKGTFVGPTFAGEQVQQNQGTTLVSDRFLGVPNTADQAMFTAIAQDGYGTTLYGSVVEDNSQYVTLGQVSQIDNSYLSYEQVQRYNENLGYATSSDTKTFVESNNKDVAETLTDACNTYVLVEHSFIIPNEHHSNELAVHENGLGPIIRYIHTKTTL